MIGTPPYTLSKMEMLKEYCQIRTNQNKEKLEQFFNWIHSSECRREGILTYFEENYHDHVVNPVCCDNCGESVESVIAHLPIAPLQAKLTYSDWKQVLASMLLISKK